MSKFMNAFAKLASSSFSSVKISVKDEMADMEFPEWTDEVARKPKVAAAAVVIDLREAVREEPPSIKPVKIEKEEEMAEDVEERERKEYAERSKKAILQVIAIHRRQKREYIEYHGYDDYYRRYIKP